MTRRLVVNADGAGLDAARDAGILEAFDKGIVRSASVVANGPTTEAFLREARERPGLGIGLHVNLTEGTALAGRAFTLTDASSRLLGDKALLWRRAVEGMVDAREVFGEVTAQWRRLVALGVEPDHVDGHEHVHVVPGIADGVLDALTAIRAGVHVRVPTEEDPPPDSAPVVAPALPVGTAVLSSRRVGQVRAGHGGLAALGAHGDSLRRRIRPPIRATDGFTGLAFGTEPSAALLAQSLAAAIGASVEFLVHPGRVSVGDTVFSTDPRRDRERRLLVGPEAVAAVERAGFALSTFRSLP